MPYLDSNATTPLLAEARDALVQALDESWWNPSSPYRDGARTRARLEIAREEIAHFIGCPHSDQLIFTSGATEANNAIFRYIKSQHPDGWVAVSAIEHPCVIDTAHASFPGRVRTIPVDTNGVLDRDVVAAMLRERERPALISVMAANNETGALQPWKEVAEICRQEGVPFHCDAAQWIGKLPSHELGRYCDYTVGSAHKFGGPKGIGFVTVPLAVSSFHAQYGGEQEHGKRAGTENYPAVAGLLAALRSCEGARGDITERLRMRSEAVQLLMAAVPGTRVLGSSEQVLWNTIMWIPPRFQNTRWVARLDKANIQVSTGSACAVGKEGPSHVLAAMGVEPADAQRALRASGFLETDTSVWQNLAMASRTAWETMLAEESDAGGTATVIDI